MAITTIGVASTFISDIKAALNAKSLITTTHYESANSLVFTLSILAGRVVKITRGNSAYIPLVYIGDAYTGAGTADTISNQVLISTVGASGNTSINVISIQTVTSPNVFSLVFIDSQGSAGGFRQSVTFFKDDQGIGYCISAVNTYSVSYTSPNSLCLRLSDKVPIDFLKFDHTPLYNAAGNLLKTDLKLRTYKGVMLTANAVGIKLLALNGDGPPDVIGNDVSINLGSMSANTISSLNNRLLIMDGAI